MGVAKFFSAGAGQQHRGRSLCASATDYAENVEVIQHVSTAVEQIVVILMPQITGKSYSSG